MKAAGFSLQFQNDPIADGMKKGVLQNSAECRKKQKAPIIYELNLLSVDLI